MASKQYHRISLTGLDLTLALLPNDLRNGVTMSSARGEMSRLGRMNLTTTIDIAVASVYEGIRAIEAVRVHQPSAIDDAALHIDYEYELQCNLELSRDEVGALARAGGALTIFCWEERVTHAPPPVLVAPWTQLSGIKTMPLWSGTVFRFPANRPLDHFVDLMLVSDQAADGRELKLLTVTGQKAGQMNIQIRFPPEAYVADAVALSSDWLKLKWNEWVCGDSSANDVRSVKFTLYRLVPWERFCERNRSVIGRNHDRSHGGRGARAARSARSMGRRQRVRCDAKRGLL